MESMILTIQKIVEHWNINCTPVQIHMSVWDINNQYILKEYSDLSVLQRNIIMYETLDHEGIPVPRIIHLSDGRKYFEQDGKFYVLTSKLKGKNIVCSEVTNDKLFFQIGTVLSVLHKVFIKCEPKISYWNNSLLEEMKGWVKRNLNQYKPEFLKEADIDSSIKELEDVYDILPKQLIHRDVHLGNFLFDDGNFSGYIDFDLSQKNIRIIDICYFLLSLLVEIENNRMDQERWFRIVGEVISGYETISPLSADEKNVMVCIMKNIELLFVAYFLSENKEKAANESARIYAFVNKNKDIIQKVISTV